jgi:PEP-CTERM motif
MRVCLVAITLGLFVSSAAGAQTVPISRTIPVTFTGVVSSTAADTILVRQPDGSLTTFAGPLPDMPYAKGDPVSISFNATLPTKAFYQSSAYSGQIAADGIYRITVSSPFYNGGTSPGGIGNSTIADVSGPISPTLNSGQPTNTRMTIVYDSNADSYSIEGGGNFGSGSYVGPGYVYDAASQSYVACSGGASCSGNPGSDPVIFGLAGSADGSTISTGPIKINSNDPTSGTGTGFFSWLFSGSWNLPQFHGATEVPEPGTMLLFGGASAILLRRRKAPKPD